MFKEFKQADGWGPLQTGHFTKAIRFIVGTIYKEILTKWVIRGPRTGARA